MYKIHKNMVITCLFPNFVIFSTPTNNKFCTLIFYLSWKIIYNHKIVKPREMEREKKEEENPKNFVKPRKRRR